MTDLDIEYLCVSLARDARLIGCASREQLTPHRRLLDEAQDEIARATEKARQLEAA